MCPGLPLTTRTCEIRTASEIFLPDDTDASQVLERKRQGVGQSAHKHEIFGDIQFFGEGVDVGRSKFAFAGLIFDLQIGVQFPDDLDIAMDIQIRRWIFVV